MENLPTKKNELESRKTLIENLKKGKGSKKAILEKLRKLREKSKKK